MVKKRIYIFFFLLGLNFFYSQVFSWQNPNLPKDSLKKDSIITAKIQQDVFTKDTLNFIKQYRNEIFEEKILQKDAKKQILGDLNAKGSVIRGVTFGNNQGSSVQSSMDLQITGKLSKDVSVLASISDHNLPVQADGYTQTLQEFDKIYLQLNIKQKSILKAGHLDLLDDQSFFGKYQRRTMGLQFLSGFEQNGNKTDFHISAGVARSEFHRIRFQGIEGNQGPYRLTGKNGELYITIISGSEEVYIDGILMKRGENQDYTINYNTGEVTFTSYRPILKQNYITISYNYTNRNYSRFVIAGGVRHERENFRTAFNFFLENDNKNAPLSLNLSTEDQQILSNAGNNTDLMYAPSGVATDYDVNKILYQLVPSPSGNYYEFSTDKTLQLYTVSFTYFGDGKGDYTLLQTTNNGKVYKYVGTNLGDYSAVRKLPAPVKSQVFSYNAEYDLKHGKIGADISFSNHDLNLFSSLDNKQNAGLALRIFGNNSFTKNNWTGTPMFEYQHISSNFLILDRINNVDYWRDFNLTNEFNNITQNRFIAGFANQWKSKSYINYKFNYLEETQSYKGIKNDIDFSWIKNSFITKGNFSYLNTKATLQNTNFTRGSISTEKTGKKGSWAIGASMEHNLKNYNTTNELDVTSYDWKEVFAQKKIGDSARTKLLTKVYYRTNDSVRNNSLERMNNILGFMVESQMIKNENTQLSTLVHYRKFFYKNEETTTNRNNDFVIGNIVYNQKFFKNGMRLQAFYELGNGQEAQREFQYVKVTDGQGIYKWTDYNGDGVQQLDEFEIAQFADQAQFIRVYTNTVKYLPSNKNKFQLALFVNPSVILNSENKLLKRWNFNISLLSQNSYLKENRVLMWNPFEKQDNQILKTQNILASAQFNPTDKSGWNGSYRFTTNDNLINANFSIEEHLQKSHILNVGYWFNKSLRADWENTLQNTQNKSELFSTRNYLLQNIETKPKITYKFTESLQAELYGALRNKKRTDGDEQLKAYELSGSLQLLKDKTTIRTSFSFINNRFSGNAFSIVGNQMLDGLKTGKNEVWSVFVQQKLNSFMSLNINYEGRNSGDRTIHIGSMQVKASF